MQILADATNTITECEIFQLINRNNSALTENDYMRIIQGKTGKLFEVATYGTAKLAQAPTAVAQALQQFGMQLGSAFQMIDDILDYQGCPDDIGKRLGDDLATGTPTLPLIFAIAQGTHQEKKLIQDAIRQGSVTQLEKILRAIESTEAIEYTRHKAEQAINVGTYLLCRHWTPRLINTL